MSVSNLPPPILITGAARSGTSMVAGIVNICGAWGGKLFPANRYNPKGMFESVGIRGLIKAYLRKIHVDPRGQFPLPDTTRMEIPITWKKNVETVLEGDGYPGGPWFCKDPKMCLIWPIWHFAFPNAKWVIVRRKTSDIVRSCLKTGFMQAFNNTATQRVIHAHDVSEGWKWWVHEHENRFREIVEAGVNAHIVWPERMVDGDYEQMQELIMWLGLQWDDKQVREFIEPKLWKARLWKQQNNMEK